MNILITHFYTRENKGDAAILTVLINQINKAFRSPNIIISTMENPNIYRDFEGYPTIQSFVRLTLFNRSSKILKIFDMFNSLISSLTWLLLYKLFHIKVNFILSKELRILLNKTLETNLIIPVGGGYLRGSTNILDNINYMMLLFQILIGIILKKNIILYSQSIGPFGTNFQKYITKLLLNKVNLIIVREDISKSLLIDIGVNKKIIRSSIDAGFLYKEHTKFNLGNLHIKCKKKTVGLTVARKWLFK